MTDRYIDVVLADPSHKLPMPGAARFFSAEGEKVDSWDPFWLALLADGSIIGFEPLPPISTVSLPAGVTVVDTPPYAPAEPAPEHD